MSVGSSAACGEGGVDAEDVEVVDASDLFGDVEGLGGAGELVSVVGSGERLDRDRGAGVEVPDRLEDGGEAAFVDQVADGVFAVALVTVISFADVVEVDGLVAAASLRLVERGVGFGVEHVGGLARGGASRLRGSP